MDIKKVGIWLVVPFAIILTFGLELITVSAQININVTLYAVGLFLIAIGFCFTLVLLSRFPILNLILGVLSVLVGIVLVLFFIFSEFKAFQLLTVIAIYIIIWGVYAIDNTISYNKMLRNYNSDDFLSMLPESEEVYGGASSYDDNGNHNKREHNNGVHNNRESNKGAHDNVDNNNNQSNKSVLNKKNSKNNRSKFRRKSEKIAIIQRRNKPNNSGWTRFFRYVFHTKRVTWLTLVITIILSFSSGLMLWFLPHSLSYKPVTFQISDQQAQSYELVLYYPAKSDINDTFCQAMKEANVSTISFPMTESDFENTSSNFNSAINAVRNLNKYNISVEVWPLFDWDNGAYPSISEIDRFPALYEKFHNWTIDNNLTVQYILWDIESMDEGINMSRIEGLNEPARSIAYVGEIGRYMFDIQEIWDKANEAIINLAKKANQDGHVVRTTTHTIIWDVFDNDGQLQQYGGIPAWDSKEAYEYISMMSYRGCEWGGNPTPSAWIYNHVKASRESQQGKIAICLGCLNYNPYPTIESVVNDVHLALAAGADSVRLFQGASWVHGVNPVPTRDVWGNPAHGLDGESGLKQLMSACRNGGEVTYYPDPGVDKSILSYLLADIALNFI